MKAQHKPITLYCILFTDSALYRWIQTHPKDLCWSRCRAQSRSHCCAESPVSTFQWIKGDTHSGGVCDARHHRHQLKISHYPVSQCWRTLALQESSNFITFAPFKLYNASWFSRHVLHYTVTFISRRNQREILKSSFSFTDIMVLWPWCQYFRY